MVEPKSRGTPRAAAQPGDPSRARRGRPKTVSDAARRATILAQARAIFLEMGYAGTTTELVASRCQISKQTLYRLFGSKTELFRALVVDHRSTMLNLPLPRNDLPLAEAIATIFRLGQPAEDERERMAFLDLTLREAHAYPELGDLLHQNGPIAGPGMLAAWLEAQRAAGKLAIENADSAARMLMDVVFGAILRRPTPTENSDRAQRDAHLRQCIRIFIDGVRPRPTAAALNP